MTRFLLAVIIAAMVSAWTAASAEPWPVKKFEIDEDSNGSALLRLLPEGTVGPDVIHLPEEERRSMEAYLAWCADQLEAWGFPPPLADVSYVNTNDAGQPVIPVYIVDLDDWDFPTARGLYEPGRFFGGVMLLDANAVIESVPGTGERLYFGNYAYSTAAHELFHAVTWNTAYFRQGRPSDYITEGTADAVGIDLARKYLKERLASSKGDGLRSYKNMLAVHERNEAGIPNQAAYRTSSFWRYLAELNLSRKPRTSPADPGRPDPGIVFQGTDYSYLARLLAREAPGRTFADEYKWLDEGLANDPWISSNLVYIWPMFTSLIAEMGQVRDFDTLDPAIWRSKFLGVCQLMEVETYYPETSKTLWMNAISGQCVQVKASGTPEIDIVIQVEAPTMKEINQIWLGTGAGQRIARRMNASKNPISGGYIADWVMRINRNVAVPLIVSNINQSPWETVRSKIKMTVTMTPVDIRSDVPAEGSYDAYGPPYDPGKDPPATGPGDREAAAKRRVKRAARQLTFNGPAASRLEPDPDRRFNRISLGVTPDLLNALAGMQGSGGFVDQMLIGGAALEGTIAEIDGLPARMADIDRTQPGSSIEIVTPYFDYGFSGTLTGVRITTPGGQAGNLQAVGPKDSLPGPQREFAPSGRVTITTYSPTVLIGTFEGQMVRPDTLSQQQREQSQPVLDIAGTVSGRFVIAAPWHEDDRFEPEPPVAPYDDLANDLARRLPDAQKPLARDIAAAAEQAAATGEEPDVSALARAAGPPVSGCDCSCRGLAALEALGEAIDRSSRPPTAAEQKQVSCAMTCMKQYAACEAD